MALKVKTPKPSFLWQAVDQKQFQEILKAFYTGALSQSDKKAYTFPDKAIPMPHVQPKGKHLIMDVSYQDIERVVEHIRQIRVPVGALHVTGWHEYVIKVDFKIEDESWQKNEMMPRVKDSDRKTALEVAGRAFARLVLNREVR